MSTKSTNDHRIPIADAYNFDTPSDTSSCAEGDNGSARHYRDTKSKPLLPRFVDAVNKSSRRVQRPTQIRARRLKLFRWALWATLAIPILILSAFGIIHIVLVIAGGSRFYWSLNDDKLFPDWGLPGHRGAEVVNYPTDVTRDVLPIPVHSHNDYWRRVPLFDALYWGCTSVEADVWLKDGSDELYVGHNTGSLTASRTFRNLYVDPILEMLDGMNKPDIIGTSEAGNQTWRGVYDTMPNQTMVLMVDLKTDGASTLAAVSSQLEALREKDYLSHWDGSQLQMRAVTVVSSGNTPFDSMIAATSRRDIFIDAPLDDLSSKQFNTSNSYYASVSLKKGIGKVWNGRLSSSQIQIIRDHISEAHKGGLKARYWDTPSWPINLRNHIWDLLMSEGADMLNADDLKAAAVSDWKRRIYGLWY